MTRLTGRGRTAPALLVLVLLAAGSACRSAGPGTVPTASRASPASATTTGPAARGPTSTPPAIGAPAGQPATGQPIGISAARRTAPAGSVLATLPPGGPAGPAGVRARLAGLRPTKVLGPRLGAVVVDPYSGAVLAGRGPRTPVAPASTTKLLTATAALDRYGAAARFRTRVVLDSATGTAAHLVLVGGGDPSLTTIAAGSPADLGSRSPTAVVNPARLPALAALTVRALRARGISAVRLDVDDTLFSGPKVSRAWPRTDVGEGYVSPVDALAVDNGRVRPGAWRRSSDPAVAAGSAFAALLRRAGFTVGRSIDHVRAAPTAASIAAVASPPLGLLLRRMLQVSDNDYAEVLLRQVAVGDGRPATFGGGVAAVRSRLAALGISQAGVRLYDGSGLSHLDRLPPAVLAAVIRTDLRTPRLATVITGMPVAGRPGSLQYRMGGAKGPAAGRVIAKTGTLTGVHDLAGVVLTRTSGPLIFVLMAGASRDDRAAEDALDDAAASLAACGCGP